METLEPTAQRAKSRVRSASVMFYLMAVVKLLALFAAMRPPIDATAPPLPPQAQGALFAWYAATIVVCSAIGFALERRVRWARPAAFVVGGLHACAVPLVIFGKLGIMSLISG